MTSQHPDAMTRPYDQPPAVGGDTRPPAERTAPAAVGQDSVNRETPSEDSLFADDERAELRARWAAVQAAFVDDPQDSVQKADVLVSDLIERLTTGFATARSQLENRWRGGEGASTEDFRVALTRYRQFFERLLAV